MRPKVEGGIDASIAPSFATSSMRTRNLLAIQIASAMGAASDKSLDAVLSYLGYPWCFDCKALNPSHYLYKVTWSRHYLVRSFIMIKRPMDCTIETGAFDGHYRRLCRCQDIMNAFDSLT